MQRRPKARMRRYRFTPTPRATGMLFGVALMAYSSAAGVKHLMYQTDLFVLEKVEISGLKYLEEEDVQKLVQVELQKPLFEIEVERVVNHVLENKYIRAASISRNIPSTLLIDVQEREPVMFLVDGAVYMVDETGIMLKKLPGMPVKDLPIAAGISVAELLKDRRPLYRALEIIEAIKTVDARLLSFVSEAHLQKDHYPILFLNNGGAKVYLGDSNHYERIYVWSELFQQTSITDNLEKIKHIDFTFSDRVVIEYKT